MLQAALCAAPRVAVEVPPGTPAPARFGLERLSEALREKGYEVSAGPAEYRVTVRVAAELGFEGVTVRAGGKTLALTGGDAVGLMYAALDAADRVTAGQPFASIGNTVERPFLKERAVSMYTMHRGWFEQRLYDERHWQRYFDLMARSRLNTFVVIFGYENGGFLAPVYPYFFDVPGFDGVRMVGLTKAEQEKNARAFRTMVRIAHEHGVKVTAAPWDHIYRGGVQGGGIPGASERAGKEVPGLVMGVTTENVAAYNKAAIRRFLEVFPEVDALQFRMHAESGLKPAEMAGFWHEVFAMIRAARPEMRVDLRAKELPDEIIDDAIRQGVRARVTTKYWMEQMGLPFHPTHVNRQNMKDRRHGYADLLKYPKSYDMVWRLWNGGTGRLLLWGDPEYVRRFAASARLYGGDSIEVNEPLATKMLGEPHDAAVRPVMKAAARYTDYEFERYWQFFRLWGRLSYDPAAKERVWAAEFERRFGAAARPVMRGLEEASRVLPRIVAAAYPYSAFPTTRGWAEMQRLGDLPKYASTVEGSDIEQFMSLKERARELLDGKVSTRRTPEQTAAWFSETARRILIEVAAARKAQAELSKELDSTLADLEVLASLAEYHSHRLPAGLAYALYQETGSSGDLAAAVKEERQAVAAWERTAAAGVLYAEDLQFGAHAVGFPHHWKEELGLLQGGLRKLEAEKAKVEGPAHLITGSKGDGRPPEVKLDPSGMAEPGKDFAVAARVSDADGVKSVVLRYRHLTQYEDYVSAPMELDAKTGLYRGVIPGGFVGKKWDVMYFVEALDQAENGRNYPDLEEGAPYVVVEVKRQ